MCARRSSGKGSVRQKKDNLWEARITLEDGISKSFYGKTYEEATQKMDTAIGERRKTDEGDILFEEWLDTWSRDFLSVKNTTRTRYELDIRRHIRPVLGKIPMSKLTTLDIQKLYRQKENEGLSLKSIKNIHGVIHSALDQAVICGIIKANVSSGCKLKKIETREMQTIVDDNLSRFLAEIKKDIYGDILFLYIFTGLRRSEGVGLTWDCIDFKNGTIKVYRQWVKQPHFGEESTYAFTSLKNNRKRVIAPASQVMDMLLRVREEQKKLKQASGSLWKNEHNFVFTRPDGSPYISDMIYKNFKKIVKRLGMGEVRLHDLRHTYATLSLQSGVDVKTVSSYLGHATAAFTLDRYSHVSESMRKHSVERMSMLIEDVEDVTEAQQSTIGDDA